MEGKGTERKMKIFKEANADLNIHFSELCSKQMKVLSFIFSYRIGVIQEAWACLRRDGLK